MAQNINDFPTETLTKILSNLPLKDLVECRTVCQKWRDVIDQHCPMKETITLEEDEEFLSRKLELRMTSCALLYFQKTTPSISLLYPQTIKSFAFFDRLSYFGGRGKYGLNAGNAHDLLFQIAPYVECLKFDPIYFHKNILPGTYPFPKLRELHVGHDHYIVDTNLEILSSLKFPLLEGLYLFLNHSNEILMDEACVNLFDFLANHKRTLKRLVTKINYVCASTLLCDFPDSTLEIDLSKKVKAILSEGQLQLESLELLLPPKYIPAWTPVIPSQNKLVNLTVGYTASARGVVAAGFQFSGISPGILSSVSTLRTVSLQALSGVTGDGLDWILLDLSVFRDAANLTELELRGLYAKWRDYIGTRRPNEDEGPWIINLNEINLRSLKTLRIYDFICNSGELQTLVDNAPVLETLQLHSVIAPGTCEKYAESGVHGGIIKSFVEKKSKKKIKISRSLNYEHEEQNEKLKVVEKLYAIGNDFELR